MTSQSQERARTDDDANRGSQLTSGWQWNRYVPHLHRCLGPKTPRGLPRRIPSFPVLLTHTVPLCLKISPIPKHSVTLNYIDKIWPVKISKSTGSSRPFFVKCGFGRRDLSSGFHHVSIVILRRQRHENVFCSERLFSDSDPQRDTIKMSHGTNRTEEWPLRFVSRVRVPPVSRTRTGTSRTTLCGPVPPPV